MAKHRHLTKALDKSNRGKKSPPARRVDASKLSKRERRALSEYAEAIRSLVATEDDEGRQLADDELEHIVHQHNQSVSEIRNSIVQYRRYHGAYPNEHPANAFTPLPREFRRRKTRGAVQTIDSTGGSNPEKLPRPGIELALIPDKVEQDRIQAFADDIFQLRSLQDTLKILPPGLLEQTANTHQCSKVWIRKSIKAQREYCLAYPEHEYVRAHTPKPVGRPKGRQSTPEVIKDIENARTNRKWFSRDADGSYSEIDNVIERRLIHSLVEQTHGAVHSERTTYRIIKDYEARRAARVAVADEGDASILQEHLPAIANRSKVRGPGERCQFDIRPLPVVVDNGGVESTVHAMLVIDDATERITSWELVFVKYLDNNGEEQTQHFDGQLCRATVARSCFEIGGRYRIYYADNGFRELKKYQPFMVTPGEDPTHVVYRRRYRARGGGGVEVGQQIVDKFLKTRPYYVRERDFRRSRKKSRNNLKSADFFKADFAQYIWHWNNDGDPKGGPSRIARWDAGPNLMLTAPSPINLAMFALSQIRDTREPRQDSDSWFTYGGVSYVGARPDPNLYERFADLSIRRSKLEAKKKQEADIKLCIFEFGGDPPIRLVLFSLDDEETWELAVPAESRALSWQRHNNMLIEVERRLEHGESADLNDFFLRTILRSANAPLVIDGLSRKRQFYAYQAADPPIGDGTMNTDSSTEEVDTSSVERSGDTSSDGTANETSLDNDLSESSQSGTTDAIAPPGASASQKATGTQRRSSGRKQTPKGALPPTQVLPSEPENDDIDIPNFIAAMRRREKP